MLILYLHGWRQEHNINLLNILSKFGDDVIYPRINYEINRNIIDHQLNDIGKNSEDLLIVGSSLGAYFGFNLSNCLRSPALLFNPTFYFKSGCELHFNNEDYNKENKEIILSLDDELIDVKKNIKFLKESGYENNLIIYDKIKHNFPLDLIEEHFVKFRNKYKVDKIKKIKTKELEEKMLKELKEQRIKEKENKKKVGYSYTNWDNDDIWFGTSTTSISGSPSTSA